MRSVNTAGGAAIAVVALGLVVTGCGSGDTTTASSSSSSSGSTSPSAPDPASRSKTIADYIKENGVTETVVKRGDAGAPTVDLPVIPGWVDAGASTPAGAYSAIISTDPAMASNPPSVVSIMSKLTGNVDPAKIFEYAPGELKNLPGYESAGEGVRDKFAGFDSFVNGVTYLKDGARRAIAQKTVVIPAKDGTGIYVLQVNAVGTESQLLPLLDFTSKIDKETVITP